MSKTVAGLFSTMAQAEQAKQALVSQGFTASDIHISGNNGGETTSAAGSTTSSTTGSSATGATGMAGLGEKVGSYLRNLTAGDDETHKQYSSGMQSGGALVSVFAEDNKAAQVAMLLKQQGAQDLQGGAQASSATGQDVYRTSTAGVTGDALIPVIEEQLVVGKRVVDHGGVRVYSHVVERPVEAEVMLREERIVVDRQPVNRAATEADFQAGNGGSIELNAMAEEAVVGKSSRVVEEVRVGKQSSEHTEAIHDSVRKTEVEVEQVAAKAGTGTTRAEDFATTTTRK